MSVRSITAWPQNVRPAGPMTPEEEDRIAAVLRERYADSGMWGPHVKPSRHAQDQGAEESR